MKRNKPKSSVVPAGVFKARCLALMDQVSELGSEIIITKHGRAVARLTSVSAHSGRPFVGRMKATAEVSGDLISPDSPDWTVDADL
ncbi:MAG: type II toxin-antitoxin system Phd/YefM family antitoxin [Myxococcaceae bacterium]